jgi:hypothetical protein
MFYNNGGEVFLNFELYFHISFIFFDDDFYTVRNNEIQ